jgi:hypothetical protein
MNYETFDTYCSIMFESSIMDQMGRNIILIIQLTNKCTINAEMLQYVR